MEKLPPDNKKLSPKEIRELSILLPLPDYSVKIAGIKFDLYKAKDFFNPVWPNKAIKRLVIEARKTYQDFYGEDISELNGYDYKSAVYLISALYLENRSDVGKIPLREWFSLRFIPASGQPLLNEDLNFYVYDDQKSKITILDLLKKKVIAFNNLDKKEILDRIVTLSRFCAIRPYSPSDENFRLNKNKHAALCFTLMNKYFLGEIINSAMDIQLLTCQVHKVMSDRLLTYSKSGKVKNLPFTLASTHLDLISDFIKIARDKKGVYAYQYPGYFLDLKHQARLLHNLTVDNKLSEKVIRNYLDKGISLKMLLNNPKITHFRRFGQLYSKNGLIDGSKITGEELRLLLNEHVKDGPVLRIIDIKLWEKGINDTISFAYGHTS